VIPSGPKRILPIVAVALVLLAGCAKENPHSAARADPVGTPANPEASVANNVLVGAGDIADCRELESAQATAGLLATIPGTIFTAGDTGCPDGTEENFQQCYAPTWGRFRDRTRPAPGNHEYHTKDAAPYFKYFGAAAGEPGKGYYSYEVAGWHIISLNSDCPDIGGCGTGSPEEEWLRQDLATHRVMCTLAYWHHPLFSSGGTHGNAPEMKVFWQDLYDANAEIVINGHDHDYERFAPQDPEAKPDPARGIRQFVVGTGGRHLRGFGPPKPNSEVRNSDSFGVLKLTLYSDHYAWQFIPVAGATFTDSGQGTCH
jgi:hypothetical protein